jgi:hypothetical protein
MSALLPIFERVCSTGTNSATLAGMERQAPTLSDSSPAVRAGGRQIADMRRERKIIHQP